jgi:hypothetical protein
MDIAPIAPMSRAALARAGRTVPLLLALLIGWALLAGAAPRFTNKDTALELAKVLDKGVFRGKLISSTFVQSPDVGDYQIKVVLDDGTELNWNIDQIRLWSQDDSITLSKNRVLVFPSLETNEFGILDKNEFTRAALRARVYAKHYSGSDVLAGQVINFAVHRFNLVDLLKIRPGHDELGYQHHYVLDYETGERDFLSYLDAWRALNSGALMEEPGSEPVMHAPYRLESIRPLPLQRIVENGTGTFGVELQFDRNVELRPGHYPFRLYERRPGRKGSPLDNNFVLEVTAPNAILPKEVNRFDALEYLNEIHAVPDGAHQNRVLLQAMIAPEVLTHPPEVEVRGRSVSVIFTKVEDQSVFDRKALHEAELRRKQEKLLAPTLSPPEAEQRKLYRGHMETGLGQLDKARATGDLAERYELLLTSLSNFREAAIQASSDLQLEEALRQRNNLADRLPGLILALADQVASGGAGDRSRVLALVRAAQQLTQDPSTLKALSDAEKKLGG